MYILNILYTPYSTIRLTFYKKGNQWFYSIRFTITPHYKKLVKNPIKWLNYSV